jgi:hypothetical protein
VARYEEAATLMERNELHAAYSIFEELWKTKPSFDVAMAMADIESSWGKFAEAARHYAYAKSNLPITGEVAYAEAINEGLDAARRHVVELRFEVTPTHAEVVINGELTERPTFTTPGQLSIEVGASGYVTDHLELLADAGEVKELKFRLVPEPKLPPPSKPEATRQDWVLWVGGSVTAGLAAGSVLSAVSAGSDRDSLNRLDLAPTQCTQTPGDDACVKANHLRVLRQDKLATAQWLALGAGVSAVGSGLLWYFWTTPPAAQLEAFASSDEFHLNWSGTF